MWGWKMTVNRRDRQALKVSVGAVAIAHVLIYNRKIYFR